MITGAHHSRELTSIQMPLYTILKLLHGYVHQRQDDINMLIQNVYYVVPIVNVDGVAVIEEAFKKTGKVVLKRKNMNTNGSEECMAKASNNPDHEAGVDLNRNYGVTWAKEEGSSTDPCAGNYRGTHPFSEPETRAIRDFLIAHKDEIKFVYNFHAYANMWLWPYNGQAHNTISRTNPGILSVFKEIWSEADFPDHAVKGNAFDALGYISSGE